MSSRSTVAFWVLLVVAIAVIGAAAVYLWPGGEAVTVIQPAPDMDAAVRETGGADPLPPAALPSSPESEQIAVQPRPPSAAPAAKAEQLGAIVTGRFVDHARNAIAGVKVETVPPLRAALMSNGAGLIEFAVPEGLHGRPAERIQVTARKDGYAVVSRMVETQPGATTRLGDILMAAGGSVSGRVFTQAGQPVPRARVVCTEPTMPGAAGEHSPCPDPQWRGPCFAERLAQGDTGEGGEFRIEGVPAGAVRVYAHAPEMLYVWSDPVDVLPGQETGGIDLILAPQPDDRLIAGIVLKQNGEPAPEAEVGATQVSDHGGSRIGGIAGEDGRFRVELNAGRSFWTVEATDPNGRFSAAVAENVPAGTLDLVLRLAPLKEIRLLVRGAEAEVVPAFSVEIMRHKGTWAVGGGQLRFGQSMFRDDGTVGLPEPAGRFSLVIAAEGYREAEVGPFEPGLVPDPCEAKLEAVACICGVVKAGGAPAPESIVTLHAGVPSGRCLEVDGFPCRSRRSAAARSVAAADGSFCLHAGEPGESYVRAERAGFAPAELGPLQIAGSSGISGIEIALSPGGSIEGRLLGPPDEVSSAIVTASRGDGFPVSVRTGEGGAFRFERLTPGPWLVKRTEKEGRLGSSSSESSGEGKPQEPIPWSCIVEEGKTTFHDVLLE